MKIYFCDECNKSIPLKDIESNRITIDAGKIYCHDCKPTASRSRGPIVNYSTIAVAALLGIGLGMVCMAVFGDALLGSSRGSDPEVRVATLEKTVAELRQDVDRRFQDVLGELEETPGVDGRMGKLARALQSIRANNEAIEQLRQSITALDDRVRQEIAAERRAMTEFREEAQRAIDAVEEIVDTRILVDLDTLRGREGALAEELKEVARRLDDLAATSVVAPPNPDPGGAESPEAAEEELDPEAEKRLRRALKQLESKEAPKRFAAVVDLLEFKSRRAEQAMVDVLDDDAEYVQTAALSNLMEMNARWAIPHIIPKLKDSNVFVREAAIAALEKLIGRPLGLTPDAPTSKVLAKIRELEEWWAKNKDSIE